MTETDRARRAQEAWDAFSATAWKNGHLIPEVMESFAEAEVRAAVEAEREACAQEVEAHSACVFGGDSTIDDEGFYINGLADGHAKGYNEAAKDIAAAIRQRSTPPGGEKP